MNPPHTEGKKRKKGVYKDPTVQVYSPLWQYHRIRTVGLWTKAETVDDALAICKSYLKLVPTIDGYFRVANHLAGVRMGYGSPMNKLRGSEIDEKVNKFRIECRDEVDRRLKADEPQLELTEKQVRDEWDDVPLPYRKKIIQNLATRSYRANWAGSNRPGLEWFLELVKRLE